MGRGTRGPDPVTVYVPGKPFTGYKTLTDSLEAQNIRGSYVPEGAITGEYKQWLQNKSAYHTKTIGFQNVGSVTGVNADGTTRDYKVGIKNGTMGDFSNINDNNFQGDLVLSESALEDLRIQAYGTTSIDSFNTYLKNNSEVFKYMSAEEFAEIQQIFDSKKSEFTEEYLKEKIEDEKYNQFKGNNLHEAVQQGTYLPYQVAGNIMDNYQVPQYYLRLFVMKIDAVKKMHADLDTDAVETLAYNIKRPDPDDIVVIAETGATDLTIDDLEIEHFADGQDTFSSTSFSWTITEPGSITLLDRLAAARNFCGYQTTGSVSSSNNASKFGIPAANGIPYFLEISLKGYKDDVDDIDNGSGEAKDIIGPYIHELAYLKFDMSIGPEGAVYNFSSHPKDNIGNFSVYSRIKNAFNIQGRNIEELLSDFQMKLNGNEIVDKKIYPTYPKGTPVKDMTTSPRTVKQFKANPNEKAPSYYINFDGIFKNPGQRETGSVGNEITADPRRFTIDLDGNRALPNYANYVDPESTFGNPEGIDANFYFDPEKVNTDDTGVGGGINYETAEMGGPGPVGDPDYVSVNQGDGIKITANITDTELADKLSDEDSEGLTNEDVKEVRTVLSRPDLVSMTIKAGTPVIEVIERIMSMSYDIVNRGTRLKNPEDPYGEVQTDKAFVQWFSVTPTVNYDFENYDDKMGSYVPAIEYRIRLIQSARTDIGISSNELGITLDDEDVKKRIQELGIAKEYLYYFTGLNDQIISLDMSFNEAFALKAPLFGQHDYKAQLAYAAAKDVSVDEAGKEIYDFSPSQETVDKAKTNKLGGFIDDIASQLDDTKPGSANLRSSISQIADQLIIGGKFDNGQAVIDSITGTDKKLAKEFQDALADYEGAATLVNAALVKSRPGVQQGSATSSDDQSESGTEEDPVNNVPLFASEVFPGLEGPGSDPRVAEEYLEQLDEQLNLPMPIFTSVDENLKTGTVKSIERGSIRNTSFAHLMNSYKTGAVSNLKIDMELRGDPWYMGKSDFYDGNNNEGIEGATKRASSTEVPADVVNRADEEGTDMDGISYNNNSNQFLLMIESPRKFDFDVEDEDQNTGFYNFENLNYTMSGVYFITRVISSFSGGMYTNKVQAKRMTHYETSKIVKVKEMLEREVQKQLEETGDSYGGFLTGGIPANAELPEGDILDQEYFYDLFKANNPYGGDYNDGKFKNKDGKYPWEIDYEKYLEDTGLDGD